MPFSKGQSGNAKGRPAKRDKHAGAITRAEKRIVDHLPDYIDNMIELANGGYERIDEKWLPAGLVTLGSGEFLTPAFPNVPPEQLVLVERKRSIADKDRAANEYLINRIFGKPTSKVEAAGDAGGPIRIVVEYGDDE